MYIIIYTCTIFFVRKINTREKKKNFQLESFDSTASTAYVINDNYKGTYNKHSQDFPNRQQMDLFRSFKTDRHETCLCIDQYLSQSKTIRAGGRIQQNNNKYVT